MRRAAPAFFIALALVSTAGAALATTFLPVGMNESHRVTLHGTAANVIVDDPSIADVTLIDTHSLIVIGRGYGATDIMVLDHAGHILFNERVRVTPPEEGMVTIHRGIAAAEFYCITNRCAPLAPATLPIQAFPTTTTTTSSTPTPTPAGPTTTTSAPTPTPGI